MPCKDQEGGKARRRFLISTKELLSPLTSQRVPPHPPPPRGSRPCWCRSTRASRTRLGNVGKLAPVQCLTNQTIQTSSQAHLETRKETLSPISETAVKTCQTSSFHNDNKSNNYNIIINNDTIQTNLDKLSKINWKHVTAAYNSGFA